MPLLPTGVMTQVVTGLPPLEPGTHDTTAEAFPAVALRLTGDEGMVLGTTAFEGTDGALVPVPVISSITKV